MKSNRIRFTVLGRPVPKKRPRLGIRGRRAYIYTPQETRAYEELIKLISKRAARKPLTGPLSVKMKVFVKKQKGDLDNIIKTILDGMNKAVYIDDSQIRKIDAEMITDGNAEERIEVEVKPMVRRE